MDASSPDPVVYVKYSTDSWSTQQVCVAQRTGSDRWGFALDASDLGLGDDLECAFVRDVGDGSLAVDDNSGANYRFICKNRPRFQPGKSLW